MINFEKLVISGMSGIFARRKRRKNVRKRFIRRPEILKFRKETSLSIFLQHQAWCGPDINWFSAVNHARWWEREEGTRGHDPNDSHVALIRQRVSHEPGDVLKNINKTRWHFTIYLAEESRRRLETNFERSCSFHGARYTQWRMLEISRLVKSRSMSSRFLDNGASYPVHVSPSTPFTVYIIHQPHRISRRVIRTKRRAGDSGRKIAEVIDLQGAIYHLRGGSKGKNGVGRPLAGALGVYTKATLPLGRWSECVVSGNTRIKQRRSF